MKFLPAVFILIFLQSGCGSIPVSQEANKASAAVQELANTTQSWDGNSLPAYPKGQPKITILRISIPAGAQLDTHKHPVINAGVLVSGQLTVVSKNGKTLHLKAGDSIIEVVDTAHYGINEGNIPAEIIVFYAGTIDSPITVVETR